MSQRRQNRISIMFAVLALGCITTPGMSQQLSEAEQAYILSWADKALRGQRCDLDENELSARRQALKVSNRRLTLLPVSILDDVESGLYFAESYVTSSTGAFVQPDPVTEDALMSALAHRVDEFNRATVVAGARAVASRGSRNQDAVDGTLLEVAEIRMPHNKTRASAGFLSTPSKNDEKDDEEKGENEYRTYELISTFKRLEHPDAMVNTTRNSVFFCPSSGATITEQDIVDQAAGDQIGRELNGEPNMSPCVVYFRTRVLLDIVDLYDDEDEKKGFERDAASLQSCDIQFAYYSGKPTSTNANSGVYSNAVPQSGATTTNNNRQPLRPLTPTAPRSNENNLASTVISGVLGGGQQQTQRPPVQAPSPQPQPQQQPNLLQSLLGVLGGLF